MGRRLSLPSMTDVILPVLNEAEALPWVLERMPDGFHPIVVDNGSTDGSGDDRGAARRDGRSRPLSPGSGRHASPASRPSTTDVVAFMDCDASLDPRALPAVADPVHVGDADLVLGTRSAVPGAWPLHARLGNRAIAAEVRRRTGLAVTDLGPMRAARRRPLLDLDILDRRFGWPFEMVLRAGAADWRIREVPVPYLPRAGRSKVTGTVTGTVRAFGDLVKVLR